MLAILLPVGSAHGTAINSAQTGNWTDSSTWSGSVVPKITDDATILNGHTVTITDVSTHDVKSLTIQTNAVLTHGTNDKLKMDIGGDLTVDGVIDANGKSTLTTGRGSGNDGSSHGGQGGIRDGTYGITYGSLTAPTDLGSKGGGFNGGGAVILNVTGTTTVDGAIQANGDAGDYYLGSGGSVYITTASLAGSGIIAANGGNASGDSTGGGGRIAVILTNDTSFANVAITAYPGEGGRPGAAGTIYLKSSAATNGTLKIDNNDISGLTTTLVTNDTFRFDSIIITNYGGFEIGVAAVLDITNIPSICCEDINSRIIFSDGQILFPETYTLTNATFSQKGNRSRGSKSEIA